ncbi:sodium/calcium exchanger 2-like isoform X1 [Mytilus galloprovincialis]|uniref:sodium/calcium exchanger 2-like isoform X1 n=1 Tax=Mytilus galloprovincialis TaxID=29158 RepID=UPI003F7C806C
MANCTACTEYLCSDKGLLMPFVNEYTWPKEARATIYFLGLLWSFMGVSIIADIFMQGIEAITGKTQQVKVPDPESETGYTVVDIKVWNGTVANLSLMALGSSAPEILLSIIEVVFNDFKAGALGPGTIVGSAAFNLMCITGVCILSISAGETKRIKKFKVFLVTGVFSLVAYLWLLIILVAITPDYIDVWEAVVTFLFFPLMVLVAYMVDKEFFGKGSVQDSGLEMALDGDNRVKGEEQNLLEKQKADRQIIQEVLRRLHNKNDVKDKDIALLTAKLMEENKEHSRGWYRINAIRSLTGGAKLTPQMNDRTEELLRTLVACDEMGSQVSLTELSQGGEKAIIEFTAPSTSILECDKRVKIGIARHGNIKRRVRYRVETFDGTAVATEDYIEFKQSLVFEPGETMNYIEIDIVDDDIWEEDEVFFAKISIDPSEPGVVGRRAITQIIVLNDDIRDTIRFPKPAFVFKESVGTALVPVEREGGCKGKVTVKYETKDLVAVKGRDYSIDPKQEIVFEKGEVSKMIEICIHDDMEFEKDENFEVRLTGVEGNCEMDKRKTRCVVTIVNDDEFKGFVARVTDLTNANLDSLRMSYTSWGKQFQDAMNVNGGDVENATFIDYILHFFTFGWKVIFSLVPPASILGGWLCFICALIAIGILTAIIGDLANIFGCLIGLKPEVTAITFVALGTSLPDLFASRAAATLERSADNAVGNVTGSNAVNVFMGLGVSWTIAAIYWAAQGKNFEVQAGSLVFSVIIYSICAVITLGLLIVRRFTGIFGNAELGGPTGPKMACGLFLICLWFFYVLLSSLQSYEYISGV